MHTEVLLWLVFFRLQFASTIFDNVDFWLGFTAGLIAAFILGYVSQQILLFLGPVLMFFKPTRSPMTQLGPSPADVFGGCLQRLIIVSFLASIIYVLLTAFL